MEAVKTTSILQMAKGAIQERVDYEVGKVVDNILDINTDATTKRTITLKIELKPDENRQFIKITASSTSKLAPVLPVGTTLGIASVPETGEMVLVETTPQVPGQISVDGTVQPQPKIMALAGMK